MKKILITSLFLANAIFLFMACETKQPVDQMLKNDSQRSEIISTFINHQPYRTEMLNAMMDNDSCRLLMGQQMMDRPEMMGMMMGDPAKINRSMDHMVNMAAQDTLVLKNMIKMMKEKPEMWNKVMRMNTSTLKNN